MSLPTRARRASLAVALILLLPPLTGCGSDGSDPSSTSSTAASSASAAPSASAASSSTGSATASTPDRITPVTITDGWAKASEGPMSGAFGTLVNNSDQTVHITGATSPLGRMELHEVAKNDAGAMVMRPVADGFTIAPGANLVLEPGGFHLMFMDMSAPLVNGESVTVTLQTSLGQVPLTIPVRRFDGANESYAPSMDHS
ncbi:MAG: copper chaperone PCu(A)C [Tetrasphaera sp.]